MAPIVRYAKPLAVKVFMSNKYVYAQVVHTPSARTLVAASSQEPGVKGTLESTSDKGAAARVGELIAARLLGKGVQAVAFEMPQGKQYHGKLRALLDALAGGGVKLL